MKITLSKALVSAMLVASTGAQAANSVANLQMFQGKVLVNHGQGFAGATVNARLNAGDSVLVGDGSSAVISFEGCTVNIAKSTVFKVTKVAPCAKGEKVAQVGDVFIAPAAKIVGPAAASGALFNPVPFVLGATMVVGGGVLLFSKNCNGISAC